jgi:hypothetical protein
MLPGVLVALQNFAPDASEDTVCVQTCKRRDPALQRVARFMNSGARQMSFYAASQVFRRRGRLTGFRSARNIVRVRTKMIKPAKMRL